MAIAIGTVPAGYFSDSVGNATVIPLPPQNGGALGWGNVYVSFAADFAAQVPLRIAVRNGSGSWTVTTVTVGSAHGRVSVPIHDGDSHISVARLQGAPANVPVSWLLETALHA